MPTFKVKTSEAKTRLDLYLQTKLPNLSRNQIHKLIANQQILVNKSSVTKNYLTSPRDSISVKLPKAKLNTQLKPFKHKLSIVYDDSDILVIDKPAGFAVHPDNHLNDQHTIVNMLLYHKIPLAQTANLTRPGIVHRLDKDTSGLLLIAKTDQADKHLKTQFLKRTIQKKYLALVSHRLKSKRGLIQAPITRDSLNRKQMTIKQTKSSKDAISKFQLLTTYKIPNSQNYLSLVEVDLITGRTHQIRVHLQAIAHPLAGDTTYGHPKLTPIYQKLNLSRQFLHAHQLTFKNTKQETITLESPLPTDLANFLKQLEAEA